MNERDAADGNRDEEALWRDLIARFEGPGEAGDGTAPWPERENLRTSLNGEQAPGEPEPGPGEPEPGPEPGAAGPLAPGLAGGPDGSAAGGPAGAAFPGDDVPPDDDVAPDDDHFIPPPPPPLPRLEPVVKGAWLALFGGPLYLLVATAAGWTVQGWAAFCAMAAFVAGFVVLVLHLGNDRRDNGSGSDDGAVV